MSADAFPIDVLEGRARWCVVHGDALAVLRTMPDASVDAIVTDPPAGISFMGKEWDHHKGGRAEWVAWLAEILREALRVAKPGAHAVVWALPRTSHWTATAIEDAGWEVRDCLTHLFGSGFPKSLDVSKAIDRELGCERSRVRIDAAQVRNPKSVNSGHGIDGGDRPYMREARERGYHEAASHEAASHEAASWNGWGTGLKPAAEFWYLARKPMRGTVAVNVLAHGTGALNVDGGRVACDDNPSISRRETAARTGNAPVGGITPGGWRRQTDAAAYTKPHPGELLGRWPPNVLLSHAEGCADECTPGCPVAEIDAQSGSLTSGVPCGTRNASNGFATGITPGAVALSGYGDTGGASRFFPTFRYVAKPSRAERDAGLRGTETRNIHPTSKAPDLMRWLARLVTPPGGVVLDPFTGSGSTGVACIAEGFRFLGSERELEYVAIARARIAHAARQEQLPGVVAARPAPTTEPSPQASLFAEAADAR